MLARVRSNFFIRFTRARCQRRKSLKYWNKGELAQLNTKSGLNIKRQCRNSSRVPGGEEGWGLIHVGGLSCECGLNTAFHQ